VPAGRLTSRERDWIMTPQLNQFNLGMEAMQYRSGDLAQARTQTGSDYI
jgi:hypothetical protein